MTALRKKLPPLAAQFDQMETLLQALKYAGWFFCRKSRLKKNA
jgi:hypothetical protein